jgi:hypothetical protein
MTYRHQGLGQHRFLGHDREVCYTRERTDPNIENAQGERNEEREVTIPGRPLPGAVLESQRGLRHKEKSCM